MKDPERPTVRRNRALWVDGMAETHIWEIRSPDGGSTGLEYARARMAPHVEVLGHSLPSRVDVEVRDARGSRVARGRNLEHPAWSPMARLRIENGDVTRENVWPDPSDIGKPVILPGGDVGILTAWWHAEDHSEWRWSIELHNHA